MKARGKREAKRSASPLVTDNQNVPALKGRNPLHISAFQALISGDRINPGRRASRLPLAFISRAVGALANVFSRLFIDFIPACVVLVRATN